MSRRTRKLLAAVVLLPAAGPTWAATVISFGPGSSADVKPGDSFPLNVTLNAPTDFDGLSLYLRASSADLFTVTNRTGASWTRNGLTDPITADSAFTSYALPASGNSLDFGYSAGSVTSNIAASGGPYAVESLTISVSPSAAEGIYTIAPTTGLTGSVLVNDSFAETDLTPAQISTYTIDVAGPVTWDGQADQTTWDLTSTANWNNGVVANSVYIDGAPVTFNDSAPTSATTINLTASVSPQSVTVNSNTRNYTIGGSGAIIGTGSLIKSGTSTLTLDGTNSYTGGTTVNAGELLVQTSTALPAHEAVTIAAAGLLKLATGAGPVTLSSLTIAPGGSLDATNNHFFIGYGSNPDPVTTIRAYLTSGYNGGKWNGAGLVSSAANLTQTTNSKYALGYADGADAGNPAGLPLGMIEIKYTLIGDLNLDGAVSGADFTTLSDNFGKFISGWDEGDLGYTGVVNGADFSALSFNFGKLTSGASIPLSPADWAAFDSFAAQQSGFQAAVPEPTTAGLLAVAGMGLLGHRRRRKS